jgi:hypothetical protein
MEEKDIIQQEENKVQDFITKIEAGNATTEYSATNQNAIKDFLIEQRRRYADAASRASRIPKNSYEYAEHAQTMSDVLASVNNLATQKNALAQTQSTFISDYENGLVSKANAFEDGGHKYANAFTGKMRMEVDQAGNILFDNNGKKEPLQGYINYTLKDYSTAQNILDMTNKVYNSGKPLNPHYEQLITASIKEQLAKGGRNTLMSLWTDGMVPGLDYKSIDKSYFKPENTEQLFNLTVEKLSKGMAQVSVEGYNAKELEKQMKDANRGGGGSGNEGSGNITSADYDLARRIKQKTNRIGKNGTLDALEIDGKFFAWGKDSKTGKVGWIESSSPVKFEEAYKDEGVGKVYSSAELLGKTNAKVKKAYDLIK